MSHFAIEDSEFDLPAITHVILVLLWDVWSLVSDPVDTLWSRPWTNSVFSPRISLGVAESINRDTHISADPFVNAHPTSWKKEENKKRKVAINNLFQVRDNTQECSKRRKNKKKFLLGPAVFCPLQKQTSCYQYKDLSYTETPQAIPINKFFWHFFFLKLKYILQSCWTMRHKIRVWKIFNCHLTIIDSYMNFSHPQAKKCRDTLGDETVEKLRMTVKSG